MILLDAQYCNEVGKRGKTLFLWYNYLISVIVLVLGNLVLG